MEIDPTRIPIHLDPQHCRMTGVTAHGYLAFDVPYITEVAENLWQGGCATGLVLPDFIDHVISLYPWEQYTINHDAVLEEFKMYDSLEQSTDQVYEIADHVNELRTEGKTVLVHCQAGLNRSSLIVGAALIRNGTEPEEAISTIREQRSDACLCNTAFEDWLKEQKND